jgi:hypothetical protein
VVAAAERVLDGLVVDEDGPPTAGRGVRVAADG